MEAARRYGTVVSYDLNYRPSLWKSIGGQARAQEVNRELAPFVDVMIGNEEDFTAALGFEVEGLDPNLSALEPANFGMIIKHVVQAFANLKVVASSLRTAKTASRNDWGGVCYCGGKLYEATKRTYLDVFDRVGGGDSFASGLIYGFLTGDDPARAIEYATAHGALAMTTAGDTSMATVDEVRSLIHGDAARIAR
jgi:2-dehydro-3-deoxygluconokinase